jgi:ABC-type glycerol-3-phosphate transport system permease component
MSRAAQLRCYTTVFAGAVASAGVIFVVLNIALIAYASWRYPHPGSMLGFWAFFTALPPSIAAAISIFLILLARSRPNSQSIDYRKTRKWIVVAAGSGLLIPVLWFLLETRFDAPESAWIELVWWAERITCPFWAGCEKWLVPAVLNAALYAFVTYFWVGGGRPRTI